MRTFLQVLLIISAVSSESVATDDCNSAELRAVLHDKSPQVIRALEELWAKAYANRDTAGLNCILADDFEIDSMPDHGIGCPVIRTNQYFRRVMPGNRLDFSNPSPTSRSGIVFNILRRTKLEASFSPIK